jgi:hypothetical protein
MPAMKNTALVRAVCRELNLADDAKFLEFVAALVRLYREGETDRLIYFSPSPEGFRDSFLYDGPNVELRVKGPFPIATISFHLALPLIDRLKREDEDGESLMGQQTLVFLDQLYGWHAEAESEKRDTSPYDGAILELRKHTARGIGFDRFIGGREFSAVASALRGDEGSEAKELAP